MKLLFVEDEVLTREGILSIVNLEEIGITEVFTADDGLLGLKEAKIHQPNIVLTDVRMPRMTGVDMAFKIREFLPACRIIFLSGYSDKEYLKAAISLSAVDYIEKPIIPKEVAGALSKAVASVLEERRVQKLEAAEQEQEPITPPLYWNSREELADRVEKYVDDSCLKQSFSLDEIADTFDLTKQHLCWVFKQEKDITISQYATERRLAWAKSYLAEHPTALIKHVAILAGFSDSNYFIKTFRKHEEITPAEYAAQFLEEDAYE